MKNIVLIGLPLVGKSQTGAALAQMLGRPHADIDTLIEARFGPIDALFARGEAYFRQCETEVVLGLESFRCGVISCGGGTVLRPENMQSLLAHGLCVHIDRPVEQILASPHIATRPLLRDDPAHIHVLAAQRAPLYAHYRQVHIAAIGSPQAVAQDICDALTHMGWPRADGARP